MSADLRCSEAAAGVGEPLSGSAPVASCWVIIEQPGPWGRQALLDSRLPNEVGQSLATATAGTGTQVLLARHPDRPDRPDQPDPHDAPAERRVWIAHTAPGDCWVRTGTVADPRDLLRLDFAALGQGTMPTFGSKAAHATLFACTHSGRDTCCAVHGRALYREVVDALEARSPELRARAWECSHLGGHRFAPTALTVPGGAVYGRLDVRSALAALDLADAGRLELDHYRGRSAFPRPLQAAEAAVRAQLGETDLAAVDALWVLDDRAVPVRPGITLDNLAQIVAEVRHADGRAWRVVVRTVPLAARPESCGSEPVAGDYWSAVDIIPAAPWR